MVSTSTQPAAAMSAGLRSKDLGYNSFLSLLIVMFTLSQIWLLEAFKFLCLLTFILGALP